MNAKEIFCYIESKNKYLNPFEVADIIDPVKNPIIDGVKINGEQKYYEIYTKDPCYKYMKFWFMTYEEYMNMNKENEKVKKIS